MENVKEAINTKPRQTIIGNIFETYNYELFSFFEENRDINPANVERIKKSFKEKRLLNPIIIDGNYKIVDGQHRYIACKELGITIQFIIDKTATIEDIPRLNTLSKTWSQKQYLEYYRKRGFENYKIMHDFILEYNITIREAIMYLHGSDSGTSHNAFKYGELVISNLDYSKWIASKMNEIKTINDKLGIRFYRVILGLNNSKKLDIDELIHKIKLQPTKLVPCSNKKQTINLIEEIYNYKRRNKVNLRI